MDKATAENIGLAIAFARGFRSGCSANVTDELDLLAKLREKRDAFFAENQYLTKPPVKTVRESHDRLIEAAKAVVMLWDIGSDDRLKDGIKLLSAAIEAQGKEGKG